MRQAGGWGVCCRCLSGGGGCPAVGLHVGWVETSATLGAAHSQEFLTFSFKLLGVMVRRLLGDLEKLGVTVGERESCCVGELAGAVVRKAVAARCSAEQLVRERASVLVSVRAVVGKAVGEMLSRAVGGRDGLGVGGRVGSGSELV